MASDQEWCLECGAARTLLRRPPDWRVPMALLVGLVVLAAIALVVTVLSLQG
jgi:CHASE1-domain containing sensor protein